MSGKNLGERAGELVRRLSSRLSNTSLASDGDGAEEVEAPLTPTEKQWIRQVRDEVAAAHMKCSNAELIQLAIVCKGRGQEAVARLKKVQGWRAEYNLDGITFEEAFRAFNASATVSGGGCVCSMGRARNGAMGFCAHYSEFLPSKMKHREAFKAIIGVFEACCSSLADVRRGVFIASETACVGYSNVSLSTEVKFAALYVRGYPVRINRIVLVDVNTAVRVVLKGLLVALPSKMRSKFALASLAEFHADHVAASTALPRFLGGSGAQGPALVEASLAQWSKLRKARATWEAELLAEYGEGFKNL